MGGRDVHLVDLKGTIVHTWTLPYPPGLYGYLTDRGTLFYNGQIPNEHSSASRRSWAARRWRSTGTARCSGRFVVRTITMMAALLKNGNIVLLCGSELPDDVGEACARRTGGQRGPRRQDLVGLDRRVDHAAAEWCGNGTPGSTSIPGSDGLTAVQDERSEWTHANGVFEQPDGDLLVSFRNISTLVRIDRKRGTIAWKLGSPPLAGQHCPSLLANGHILIFDNGPHRLDESFPFSRVLEIDPATKAIVWKYQEARPFNFFSPRISNAQRLPNGNTLINEGNFGRMFEVTAAGDVVWEFVNPYFGPSTAAPKLQQNAVFRAYRYPEEAIARAQHSI